MDSKTKRIGAAGWLSTAALLVAGCGSQEAPIEPPVTEPDVTAPSVSGIVPEHGAEGIEPAAPIEITFDEPLDAASVALTVVDEHGAAVAGGVEVDGAIVRFVPAHRLALRTAHTLSISASDLAGNSLSTPFTSSFSIRDGAWSDASSVDSRGASVAEARTMSLRRGAAAVWTESGSTQMQVRTSRYAPGHGWQESEKLWEAGTATAPAVATSKDLALVSWQGTDDGGDGIFAARLEDGTWSTVERLDGGTGAWQPTSAIDATGSAYVAWYEPTADGTDVVVRRYGANGWGPALVIDPPTTSGSSPSLAAGNGAVLAWVQADANGIAVFASEADAEGTWSDPMRLSDADLVWAWAVETKVAGDVAAVAWIEIAQNGETRLVARTRIDGTWSDSRVFGAGGNPDAPRLAVNESGVIALAWQHWGAVADVRASISVGGAWSAVETLDTDDSSNTGIPSLSLDATGALFVTWDEGNATRVVKARRFSDGSWGELLAFGEGTEPMIGAQADGSAICVWRTPVGVRYAAFE